MCAYAHDITYKDADYKSWYGPALRWCTQKNITNYSRDKIFGPDYDVFRSYAIEYIWRFYGRPTPKSTTEPYYDVKDKETYREAILWGTEKHIINGESVWYQGRVQTRFDCYRQVSRAEFVTMLWRSQGCPEPTWKHKISFTDVPYGSYYYKAVFWAVENGILKGTSPSTFSPGDRCTNAHVVTMLYRMRSML